MPTARLLVLVAVPVAAIGSAAGLGWASAGALAAVRAPGPATFDELLALTAALAACSVFGWLCCGLLLTLAAEGLGPAARLDRVARATAPYAVRRLAALLLGVGLVGAPVALAFPAQAAPVALAATQQPGPTSPAPAGLDGWSPDRPAQLPTPARPSASRPATEPSALLVPRPHRQRAVTEHVVVRRGDTLWDIAARALGPNASAADIAASWPRWYAANRSTIGPDPDLILPGQLLRPPGT